MNKMLSYVSLQTKLRYGEDKRADKKGQIITLVISIITAVVLLFILKVFFDISSEQLYKTVSMQDFSIIVFMCIEIALTIYCLLLEIKYLLNPSDINITSRFPMSSIQIFLSELLMVYVNLFIVSTILTTLIMLILGWSSQLITGLYIGKLILTILFMPLIPFAISTMIATPMMLILTLLKNQFVIKLILFVAIISMLFVAYNYVLDILADYYIYQRITNETINVWTLVINKLNQPYNFLSYIKNIMFGNGIDILYNILYVIAIFIGGSSIGISLSFLMYGKIRRDHQEGSGKFFSKKTKITNDNAFIAIFKKDFLEIMRTQTYSFFYLGVAISTPVMVFLVNRLMSNVGKAQLGQAICFGVAVLVICSFMAMINSFTATSISREEKAFYITKMIPVRYKVQLLSKGLLNIIVSIGALLISTIIIATLKFLNSRQIIFVFFIALTSAIGMIFNGYLIDIKKPNLVSKSNGEINETNLSIMLFIGLFVSIIEGALSVILTYLTSALVACYVTLSVAIVYAIITAVIFFVKSEKWYGKIGE